MITNFDFGKTLAVTSIITSLQNTWDFIERLFNS